MCALSMHGLPGSPHATRGLFTYIMARRTRCTSAPGEVSAVSEANKKAVMLDYLLSVHKVQDRNTT